MVDVQYKQFDEVIATFTPKIMETLRPEAKQYIGTRIRFYASWLIEGGLYNGQWAWQSSRHRISIGWVPTEDLSDIQKLENH